MNSLKKINQVCYRVCKKIGSFFLFLLIVIITSGIVARKGFKSPLIWTEELSTFLFIWVAFLGAVSATYEKRHIAVDFLIKKFPQLLQDIVKVITYVLILMFQVLLVFGALKLIPMMLHVSVALRIPKYLYYMAICVASATMFLMYLDELIDYVKGMRIKGEVA
ncbi:MAG: TRAP transporter small permease [Sphaerochaetaceae bacterium]